SECGFDPSKRLRGAARRPPSATPLPRARPAQVPCARCRRGARRGRAGSGLRGSSTGSRSRPSTPKEGRSRDGSVGTPTYGRPPPSIGFIRGERLLDGSILAVAERVLALQDRVDLARALIDDGRASVPQKTLDGILGRVAVGAMDLDGVVGRVEGGVGGGLLGGRHVTRVSQTLVL